MGLEYKCFGKGAVAGSRMLVNRLFLEFYFDVLIAVVELTNTSLSRSLIILHRISGCRLVFINQI